MNACFNQSTINSDAITMTTGVIKVFNEVEAGNLNNGTKVDGKIDEGPDSDNSITLRKVMMNKNAHC
jgi:hypothetical protein